MIIASGISGLHSSPSALPYTWLKETPGLGSGNSESWESALVLGLREFYKLF